MVSHFYTTFRMHAKFSVVSDPANLWTAARQAPLSVDSPVKNTEGVAMPFSRGSSRPRDCTHVSCSSCIAGGVLTTDPLWEPLTFRLVALLSLFEQNGRAQEWQ